MGLQMFSIVAVLSRPSCCAGQNGALLD